VNHLSRLGRPAAGLALAAALVAACSSPASTTVPSATDAGSPPASAPASGASATAASPVAAGAKVNANTASESELAAAFSAAGIPNADRWAREVAEYRPYDADPTWAKLRQELAKYNIDPAVLERIIAVLEL
jgi:hypothetical protein